MNELKIRLKKIESLKESVDSVLLLSNDPGFFYFTNSDVKGIFLYDFSEPKLIVPAMEKERAKNSWIKHIEVVDNFKHVFSSISSRVGIDKKHMPAAAFSRLKAHKDVSEYLENARAVKTKYEINCIRKACLLSKQIFFLVKNRMNTRTTEQKLKAEIEYEIAKRGLEPAFPTIVAGGSNTRMPHHKPTGKKLSFPILLDFGVCYKGYKSDVTRTIGSQMAQKIEEISSIAKII